MSGNCSSLNLDWFGLVWFGLARLDSAWLGLALPYKAPITPIALIAPIAPVTQISKPYSP